MNDLRRAALPALALTLTCSVLLLRLDWPVPGGDTGRLLEEASNLASGQPLSPRGAAFLLPHALVALLSAVGLPLAAYVVVQITLALAATAALFALTRLAGGSALAATLAATAWAANPFVQEWNLFLLSDGLYQSLLVITAYALVRAATHRESAWAIAATACVVATSLCRPQGQVLPLIACIALVSRRGALQRIAAAFLAMLQAALAWIGRHYAEYLDVGRHLVNGQIIWGYFDVRLSMPPWSGDGAGMSAVLAYCAAHPIACGKLAITRVLVELSAVRPFYSPLHNALGIFFYWPLYALALLGLWRSTPSPARTMTVLVFVAHVAIVGVAHADWDGRWFLEVLPFLLVWASLGVTHVLERWSSVSQEA